MCMNNSYQKRWKKNSMKNNWIRRRSVRTVTIEPFIIKDVLFRMCVASTLPITLREFPNPSVLFRFFVSAGLDIVRWEAWMVDQFNPTKIWLYLAIQNLLFPYSWGSYTIRLPSSLLRHFRRHNLSWIKPILSSKIFVVNNLRYQRPPQKNPKRSKHTDIRQFKLALSEAVFLENSWSTKEIHSCCSRLSHFCQYEFCRPRLFLPANIESSTYSTINDNFVTIWKCCVGLLAIYPQNTLAQNRWTCSPSGKSHR